MMGGFDNYQSTFVPPAFIPQPVVTQAPAGLSHASGVNRQAAKSFIAACIAKFLAVIAAFIISWSFAPWSIGAIIVIAPIFMLMVTRRYNLETVASVGMMILAFAFSVTCLVNFDAVANSILPPRVWGLRLLWNAHFLIRSAVAVLPAVYLVTYSHVLKFFLHQLAVPDVYSVGDDVEDIPPVVHQHQLDVLVTERTGIATSTTRRAEITLPGSMDVMLQFVEDWSRRGGGLSERRAKELGISRERFNQFRDELIAGGLAFWRNGGDARQGWALTAAGMTMMRKLAEESRGKSDKVPHREVPLIPPEEHEPLAVPPVF